MTIFVGVTPQEVAHIENAVREHLMAKGVNTSRLEIEARNVYLEADGTITASLRITEDWMQVDRSTYILRKEREDYFEVIE